MVAFMKLCFCDIGHLPLPSDRRSQRRSGCREPFQPVERQATSQVRADRAPLPCASHARLPVGANAAGEDRRQDVVNP
jgi:hypothetical protein